MNHENEHSETGYDGFFAFSSSSRRFGVCLCQALLKFHGISRDHSSPAPLIAKHHARALNKSSNLSGKVNNLIERRSAYVFI